MATKDTQSSDLYLVDGNSIAYRAYFALPETMATSDGRPTNAIFGFSSMMAKLLIDEKPAAVVVAWDAGKSGREKVYPEYKAQRKSRPDLLVEQWPHFEPVAAAFGFANVRLDGWEADDVIASLAVQARDKNIPVMILTGDRDAYQLVGDGVRVMSTGRGVTETKTYDREAVIERYGVPPELVTDLIGLKGDTSDNIPGVPGIGEKTATKLLQEFGSLEAVLESVDKISGAKRKENLTNHADDARVSKQLAEMHLDLDTGLDLAEVMALEPDRSRLREMAAEFEMRAIIQRLEDEWDEELPEREAEDQLEAEAGQGTIADLAKIDGNLAFALAGPRWAAGTDDPTSDLIAGDAPPLADLASLLAGRPLVVHDAKSLGVEGRSGAAKGGLVATGASAATPLSIVHDTMVAAYLIDPSRRTYDLEEICADEGISVAGIDPRADEGEDGQLSLGEEAPADSGPDPAARVRLTQALAALQRPRIEELGLNMLLEEIELPLIEVLAAMEREGLGIDLKRLAEISTSLAGQADQLQTEIWELAEEEFTIGSPQQLGSILFEKLSLTRKRRGKTGFSTDARVLAQIRDEHPIVEKVERWRELTKLANTYLDALPKDVDPTTGRIHTTFSQVRAATGRLSSTDPNLQNIPIRSDVGRPVRSCFVAREGMTLLAADYNQVELRVLAHVAGEESLRQIFASGEDVHSATAAGIIGADPDAITPVERSKAKMVNYGIAYGLSAFGLADRLQIGQKEAAAYIDSYFERYPAIKRLIDETIERATDVGYVSTLLGRRRRIPELRARRWQTRSQGERLAVNTIIQGTAADIIKLAMIRSYSALREEGLQTKLILQIHDELLFEGPPEEMEQVAALAEREMCGAYELDPELRIDTGIGPDWLSAK